MTLRFVRRTALLLAASITIGCAGRASFLPNPDPQLRKSSAQFAADAAKRHPYKADAPRGGEAPSRAQVGYILDRLEVVNLSDQDWKDVEVWVNQQYVVYVPDMQPGSLKQINFQMLYDDKGNSFTTNNKETRIKSVEVFHDGEMCSVPLQLAD